MKKFFTMLLFVLAAGTAKATPILDLTIIMDSSGSVGAAGWSQQQSFVIDLVENQLPSDVRISVISFSNRVDVIWNFFDSQDRTQIASAVDDMSHISSTTHTRDALNAGIQQHTNYSVFDANRSILLITDGVPYPSSQYPCDLESSLIANDISLNIVGVGTNWNPSSLSCLLDDPNSEGDIFEIESFSVLAGTDVIDAFDFDNPAFYNNAGTCTGAGHMWDSSQYSCVAVSSNPVPAPGGLMIFVLALVGLGVSRALSSQTRPANSRCYA